MIQSSLIFVNTSRLGRMKTTAYEITENISDQCYVIWKELGRKTRKASTNRLRVIAILSTQEVGLIFRRKFVLHLTRDVKTTWRILPIFLPRSWRLLITRHPSLPSGIIVFYVILLKTIFQLTGKTICVSCLKSPCLNGLNFLCE